MQVYYTFDKQFTLIGLRGAIAFVLAFQIPTLTYPVEKRTLITTTLFIILFTIFVQGTTIKFVLKSLGIGVDQEKGRKAEPFRTGVAKLYLNESDIITLQNSLKNLDDTMESLPHNNPERSEFQAANRRLLKQTMKQVIAFVKTCVDTKFKENAQFHAVSHDVNIAAKRLQSALSLHKAWNEYLYSQDVEQFSLATKDFLNFCDFIQDNMFVEQSTRRHISEYVHDIRIENIDEHLKASPFVEILLKVGLITSTVTYF